MKLVRSTCVPTANWLLMAGTLLVVVLFKTSENLAGAYGIAVSGTMLITTMLVLTPAIRRTKRPTTRVVPLFLLLLEGQRANVVVGLLERAFEVTPFLPVIGLGDLKGFGF